MRSRFLVLWVTGELVWWPTISKKEVEVEKEHISMEFLSKWALPKLKHHMTRVFLLWCDASVFDVHAHSCFAYIKNELYGKGCVRRPKSKKVPLRVLQSMSGGTVFFRALNTVRHALLSLWNRAHFFRARGPSRFIEESQDTTVQPNSYRKSKKDRKEDHARLGTPWR